MKRLISFFAALPFIYFLSVAGAACHAQNNLTTFTVDPSFSTDELFRGGGAVGSIVPYADGRILLAGDFAMSSSPFSAIGIDP